MAGGILVAKRTAALVWHGRTLVIQAGETFAREGHPILDSYGDEFEPIMVHFEVDDSESEKTEAPKAPPAPEPSPPAQDEPKAQQPAEPAPKDVRAWAAEQGIDVPARGKLPENVVQQYQAAHTEA